MVIKCISFSCPSSCFLKLFNGLAVLRKPTIAAGCRQHVRPSSGVAAMQMPALTPLQLQAAAFGEQCKLGVAVPKAMASGFVNAQVTQCVFICGLGRWVCTTQLCSAVFFLLCWRGPWDFGADDAINKYFLLGLDFQNSTLGILH